LGEIIWQPSQQLLEYSYLSKFMKWVNQRKGLRLHDYQSLWQWSVDSIEEFWESVWEFFQVQASRPYTEVLIRREMPDAEWFPGAHLNYAEHIFRNRRTDKPALLYMNETSPVREMSWDELYRRTAAVADYLKRMGLKAGDRVVGYLPNVPEAVIAFLACASLGVIWSCCAPDLGTTSVIARFRQIEPTILFAADGYRFNGQTFDRTKDLAEIRNALPSLKQTVLVPTLEDHAETGMKEVTHWDALFGESGELEFAQVPFSHPLWILFSSGTTGEPKGIVHGHGGILLEHLKNYYLHQDLSGQDVFFWFSSTSWMMWNIGVSVLLTGATLVLYDGSPNAAGPDTLWRLAAMTKATVCGAGAGYIHYGIKAGANPKQYDLSSLRAIGVTGAPLTEAGFRWIYEQFPKDIWLLNSSGGTDVCTAFVHSSPILPIYIGELQCAGLGVKLQSFDEAGNALTGQVGELVVTEPMPSMPLYFWNDPDKRKYREAYFDMYPGVWRHGDWIMINERGGCVIYGRSDSTINKNGVRMGTSEIYQAVESIEEVVDSLVVDLEYLGRPSFMPMFVVLKDHVQLDDALKARIKEKIAQAASKRHVPNEIYQVRDIPKTLNGKKMEVPIRKLLLRGPEDAPINRDTMSNPESLDFFIQFARELNRKISS
jgi:acetoacetyl-CoA synthetase